MKKCIGKFAQVGGCFFMKRTVGSAEAWEYSASTAHFFSERSENAPVFPANLPFARKGTGGHLFNGTIAIFFRAKGKLKVCCYNNMDEKIKLFCFRFGLLFFKKECLKKKERETLHNFVP